MNQISDFSFVDPNVIIGDNNTICEGAIIRAGVQIGDNNYIGPYCIIGDDPEKVGWFGNPFGVCIGSGNRFTKQVTIDSGTERYTRIGDNVLMLKNAHCGHDSIIRDNVVLSCNSVIGGWTVVNSGCNFGLGAIAHQRLDIPEGCMFGMNAVVTKTSKLSPNRKYVGVPVKDIAPNK